MKKLISIVAAILFLVSVASAQVGVAPQDQGGTPFSCTMISTATTLTEITGCAAPAAGLRYHIQSIHWSSSIISTTTNFMLVRSGTGTNCGTNTVSHYAGFIAAAFTSAPVILPTPIRAPAGHALCFIHPGAGTRNITVTGYISR